MDDPNITMEEYIRLEEEKARRHSRTFNWQTATFWKIENYEDEDDYFIDFETEFSAIVFDNTLTAIPSEPTVCPPNKNEIDFRISLDESDDEDYTVIFDENSFSYKIIFVNDLKTDSKNDNNNMPASPNPTIDYIDDLDFFKEFENEFPAIVYNDARTSKSDYLTEPILNPQYIDEFNLNDETSLSKYDEENVSRFHDLFNIIHPDDLKSEKDNDDNDIDIEQSLEGNKITHGSNRLSETSHDKIIKTFETGSFVINLKVNIVIWNYYVNGMLFFLIINLYVPFGILFDPKLYYKDGSHTKVAEAKEKDDIETVYLGVRVTHGAGDGRGWVGAYWDGSGAPPGQESRRRYSLWGGQWLVPKGTQDQGCYSGMKCLALVSSELLEGPCTRNKTPLTLSWERIPQLDSDVRINLWKILQLMDSGLIAANDRYGLVQFDQCPESYQGEARPDPVPPMRCRY
ncbi:hypothetical protein Tco_0498890 [Tanacetum coccineum]